MLIKKTKTKTRPRGLNRKGKMKSLMQFNTRALRACGWVPAIASVLLAAQGQLGCVADLFGLVRMLWDAPERAG